MKSSNKPPRLVLYASKAQIKRLHIYKRDQGMSEDEYRVMIYGACHGRTDSSKFLYRHEATALMKRLFDPNGVDEEQQQEQLEVVKDIFGVSYSIGILNKDYRSDDPYEIEMNKAKISSFLKKRGTIKKEISKQNLKELKATLKQLQKMKKEGK